VEIGQSFVTSAGRLKRRGLYKIYHTVIKRLQSDFTSIYIVENAIANVFKKIASDGIKSVSICGIGIDPGDLDKKTIARITVDNCLKYVGKINVKIIDNNIEFIKECKDYVNKIGIEFEE
jgi:O-acetyl-ADP-ribose deacetylase (regulator of RNase III)